MHTEVQFECSGDAVQGLQAQTGDAEAVTVHVDEPRGDDPVCDVERAAALQRGRADRGGGAPVNADVADPIGCGFGVDNPSAAKHEVIEDTGLSLALACSGGRFTG